MPSDTVETLQDAPLAIPVPPPPQKPAVQPAKQASPDDDPNLKLQQIVSRRRTEKKEEPKPEEKTAVGVKTGKTGDSSALSAELGKFLGFQKDKPAKPAEKQAEEDDAKAKAGQVDEKKQEKKPEEAGEPGKTIVKAKKAASPAGDPARIAAAAATAAVKAMLPEPKPPAPDTSQKPEDLLKPDDLHEYEVARYLAESNPRYKDAPRMVLEHVRKAETYAARWEQENKGKVFNPNDEEHNEFFEALEKPWSDHEFRGAEMEMAAERVAERKTKVSDQKIRELELENARTSLAPLIERAYAASAGVLAKKIGQEIHDNIVKNTFEKFTEEDPVTAGSMAAAMGQLQPIIEAAIQLDDPKMRFRFDPTNATHLEWSRLMLEKEELLSGTDDGHGRTMVGRADYAAMQPAQRAKHWYLTAAHLIEEMVGDAAETVKKEVEKANEGFVRFAEKRGYVLQKKSDPTKTKQDDKKQDSGKEPVKPESPSAGGSAKIDSKTDITSTGTKRLLETTASILFNR